MLREMARASASEAEAGNIETSVNRAKLACLGNGLRIFHAFARRLPLCVPDVLWTDSATRFGRDLSLFGCPTIRRESVAVSSPGPPTKAGRNVGGDVLVKMKTNGHRSGCFFQALQGVVSLPAGTSDSAETP